MVANGKSTHLVKFASPSAFLQSTSCKKSYLYNLLLVVNKTNKQYKDSPTFVNVTGLKSLDDIGNYKLETEKLFTQKVVKVRIDNKFLGARAPLYLTRVID